MTLNAFEQVAADRPEWAKRRDARAAEKAAKLVVLSDKDAPMKPSAQEQDQIDQSKQMKIYRQWVKDRRTALIEGPHGKDIAEIVQICERLSVETIPNLVAAVKESPVCQADDRTRHEVLSLIAGAIIKLRKKLGLAPFDDALFDETPLAFELIRKQLTGVGSF